MHRRRFQPQHQMTSEGGHSLRLSPSRGLLRTAAAGSQGPFHSCCPRKWDSPGGSAGKESVCQCRRHEFNPWVGRSLGGGNRNPLQYSCLKNPMDRGAWWATVHEVAEVDRTELSVLIPESIVASPRKGKGKDPCRYESAHGVDKTIKKRQSHQGKCK